MVIAVWQGTWRQIDAAVWVSRCVNRELLHVEGLDQLGHDVPCSCWAAVGTPVDLPQLVVAVVETLRPGTTWNGCGGGTKKGGGATLAS